MNSNKIALTVATLLLVKVCFAQQLMPVIAVTIEAKEGKISISHANVVVDYLSEPELTGEHAIKLKDAQGRTLYQLQVYMHGIGFPPYGEEMSEEERKAFYESLEKNFLKTLYLPYFKEAVYITLEDSNGIVARFDLRKLCNNNGVCEESENYLSCSNDCPLNKKDNYCLPLKDSICDPDCSEGIDIDCSEKKGKGGFDIFAFISSNYIIVLALVLILIVIAVYRLILIRKKRKK